MDVVTSFIQGDLAVAVVGALIALVGGLIGIIVQSGRAHKRWLREKRYEASRDYIALSLELRAVEDAIQADEDAVALEGYDSPAGQRVVRNSRLRRGRISELRRESHQALAAIMAIGPDKLTDAAGKLFSVTIPSRESIDKFAAASRRILKSTN